MCIRDSPSSFRHDTPPKVLSPCLSVCPQNRGNPTREDRTADGGARFFSTRLRSMSRDRRKSVVETNHPRLGVVQQCHLLGLCRSTFYYKTAGETPKNLALMKRLDEIFLDIPVSYTHLTLPTIYSV